MWPTGFLAASVALLLLAVSLGRCDAKKRTLKVVSILNEPFLMLKNDSGGDEGGYKGFIIDLMDEITKDMADVDYQVVLSEDGKYGTLETGEWNGMIGMVEKGKGDLIAADLTTTFARQEVLDFSRSFMSSPLTVLTKRDPRPTTSSGMFNFFQPFETEVWLTFLIAYVVTGVTLWIVARITPYEKRSPKAPPVYTLTSSLWFIFSSVFRGSNIAPQAFSTRLVAAAWWIFALAVFATYATILKSFIAENFEPSAFHVATDLQELLEKPNFKLAVTAHGSSYALLEGSNSQTHRALFNRIMENPEENLLTSITGGVEKLLHPETKNFGILAEGVVADHMKGLHCDLYSVGHLNDRSYAFAFPKDNRGSGDAFHRELREKFSRVILRLVESGQMHSLKEKWWDAKRRCLGDEMATTMKDEGACKEMAFILGMKQMAWPFILLAVAIVLSLFLSVSELVFYIMNAPKPPNSDDLSRPAIFFKSLKEAFCGCCSPPPPPQPRVERAAPQRPPVPKTSVSAPEA